MKIVWFPAWVCQNYTFGESYGEKCPYCPYSLNTETNRLIYNNQETSSDDRAEASDLIAFFVENYKEMNGSLEVSGGEALLRRDLPFILAAIPHKWSMTSNTLASAAIDSIISTGAILRCNSWTASWHPRSGREELYARNIRALADVGRPARATVVVAKATLEALPKTVEFLNSLPLAGVNWHLDTHGDQSDVQAIKESADRVLGEGVAYLAGPAPRGRLCNRHDKLMAVGPDGTLYECVTFAYQNKHPIGKVNGRMLLKNLPQRIEWCDEECFACCDHIKHEAQS